MSPQNKIHYRKRPVLKNDSLIERYPTAFKFCFLAVCFGALFSRPIYDCYIGFKSYLRQKEMLKNYESKREKVEQG